MREVEAVQNLKFTAPDVAFQCGGMTAIRYWIAPSGVPK
jgi:hypothetical protein